MRSHSCKTGSRLVRTMPPITRCSHNRQAQQQSSLSMTTLRKDPRQHGQQLPPLPHQLEGKLCTATEATSQQSMREGTHLPSHPASWSVIVGFYNQFISAGSWRNLWVTASPDSQAGCNSTQGQPSTSAAPAEAASPTRCAGLLIDQFRSLNRSLDGWQLRDYLRELRPRTVDLLSSPIGRRRDAMEISPLCCAWRR